MDKKEIKVMVRIKDGFVSTNALYAARVGYAAGGRPYAQVYKNPKAVAVERLVREQLRAIDFSEYREFLEKTKSFKLLIQFIVKSNISRKDTSNYIKNLEDIWTRFVKEDLGIESYDDRLHIEVHAYKSIIPKAKEEIACISLSESKFNTRFDLIEEPERVFLGGTCTGTDWRREVMRELKKRKIKFFNPVLPADTEWTPQHQEIEDEEKEKCNTHIYVITPEMKGVYSIAECIDSAYTHQERGFCFLGITGTAKDWGEKEWKSLNATINLVNNKISSGENVQAAWLSSPMDILMMIDSCRSSNE